MDRNLQPIFACCVHYHLFLGISRVHESTLQYLLSSFWVQNLRHCSRSYEKCSENEGLCIHHVLWVINGRKVINLDGQSSQARCLPIQKPSPGKPQNACFIPRCSVIPNERVDIICISYLHHLGPRVDQT